MPVLYLPNSFSDNFGDPIQKVFNLVNDINSISADELIILNYDNARFTHPFFSMAIPLIIKQNERIGRVVELQHNFSRQVIKEYMKHINFPKGIDPGILPQGRFPEYLATFRTKTYLPIINFPTGDGYEITQVRDHFLSAINQLLMEICGLKAHMTTALMYLIDEAVNNVLHHAHDDKGYLLAQFYQSKGYIDIVIADIGRTLLESYQSLERYKMILSNKDAMEAALAGKSTKSGNVDRGFGISTSKDMLTKGLNGKYFLWSGNVINIHTSERNEVVDLSETINWQGVYLCLRIPIVSKQGFNPYDYIS